MRRGVVKRALLQTESLAAAGRALRETDEAQLAALRLKLDQLTPRHQLLKAQYEKILLAERTRLEAQVTQQPAGGGGAAAEEEEEDREDREETGEVVQEREWASSRECSMDDGCGVSASSQDWSGPAWKAVDGDNNPVCRLVTRNQRDGMLVEQTGLHHLLGAVCVASPAPRAPRCCCRHRCCCCCCCCCWKARRERGGWDILRIVETLAAPAQDYDGALSCMHTNEQDGREGWWQIDLREEVSVARVVLQVGRVVALRSVTIPIAIS